MAEIKRDGFIEGAKKGDRIIRFNKSVPFRSIDALKKGIVSPSEIPPIRVFEKDGLIYSLDNRRLLAASAAGVPIKIVPATAADIRKEVKKKMTTLNKGVIICVRDICK